MGWLLLLLGLALWVGAHLFKRLAPAARAKLGEPGKGLVAVLLALAIVLMVVGYRAAPITYVWFPPEFFTHINNLLMIGAFYFFGIGGSKGRLAQRIRHPQLAGFKTWAVAHLLVNGSAKAMVLFGGLLAWGVAALIIINRQEPEWTPPAEVRPRGDLINLAIALVLYGIVAAIHSIWVWPFG